jgi:hypothetical protein
LVFFISIFSHYLRSCSSLPPEQRG